MLGIGGNKTSLQIPGIVRGIAPVAGDVTVRRDLAEFDREVLGLVQDMRELVVDGLDVIMVQSADGIVS